MDNTIFENYFVAFGALYMNWVMMVAGFWLAFFLIKGLARWLLK